MSYLVIARKWRPNLFSEIVGQEHVTRTLQNAVSSERIAHAYLFSGPRGVGKTSAARILARCINCANGPTPTPCNKCDICKAITEGSSIDVIEIDGASNTSVDNIRELRDGIKFMPQSSRYKVYIIDEVHMLSTSAFNALLKTLEEPPPHVVFIFATTEVHKIPRTILSRCQRFDFKRIPFKDIVGHLALIADKEGIKVAPGVLEQLAREADGSMRDAESLLDQVIAFSGLDIKESDAAEALGLMDRTILFDLSGAVLDSDSKKLLSIIEKLYEFGYDFKKVCLELLEHVRDLTVLTVTGDMGLLDLPPSEAERLKELATGKSMEKLQMIFSVISKGYDDISRSSTPRFALEMTLLRAASIEELRPISEVIDTLKALGGGGPGAPEGSRVTPRAKASPPPGAFSEPPSPKSRPAAASEEGKPYAVKENAPAEDASKKGKDEFDGDILEFIKTRDKKLADYLHGATFSVKGERLDVIVDKPLGFLKVKMGTLEELCRDFYKRPVMVNIAQSGERQAGSDGKQEAATDELVSDAVKILGGKIIEDRRRTDV